MRVIRSRSDDEVRCRVHFALLASDDASGLISFMISHPGRRLLFFAVRLRMTIGERLSADLCILRPQPGENVTALPAYRARPPQILQRFAFLAGPPKLLNHHERPTAATGTSQRKDLDGEPVLGSRDAVPFTFKFNAVVNPMRPF